MPNKDEYYNRQFAKLEHSEFCKQVIILDGLGNQTNHLNISIESIPQIVRFLSKEAARLFEMRLEEIKHEERPEL